MFPNCNPTSVGVVPTYGVDGGMCPPFQGNPWTKAEDPVRPLWVVCAKDVGIVGTLGRDNFRGEFYPSGLFFHVFLPKNIHHFAFFEALFHPILMG